MSTRGIRATVEETGWSSSPWPKQACRENLRKTMGGHGKSTETDSRSLVKEMTVMGWWLMLTRTNYAEWALLMQVNLRAWRCGTPLIRQVDRARTIASLWGHPFMVCRGDVVVADEGEDYKRGMGVGEKLASWIRSHQIGECLALDDGV
jgi:hypothetical protein